MNGMPTLTIVGPELIERFRTDGFVVVPDLLPADELEHFQLATRAAVAARKAEDQRALQDKRRYEQSFVQCQNLWEDFPEVRPLTFHLRLAQAAAELLG